MIILCRRYPDLRADLKWPKDWHSLFPNPVLAEGALDRLINRSHNLVLEGRSYRPLLRPDRNTLAKENESK